MSSTKWKGSYDKGRKGNIDWEKTFLWLKKASDGSQDAYCKLCHATIIPRLGNVMNHEKNEKRKSVPAIGQVALKIVKTSRSKSDALIVPEVEIAVSIICYSAIRFIDHLLHVFTSC